MTSGENIYISDVEDSFMPEIFPVFAVVAMKESNAADDHVIGEYIRRVEKERKKEGE